MTRKLLISRPKSEAERLAARCGAFLPPEDILVAPVQEILRVAYEVELDGYDAVIFTSKNAVSMSPDGDEKYAFCVGSATAKAAQLKGFKTIVGAGNVRSLYPEIERYPDLKTIYLRGETVRVPLKSDLGARNINIDELVVYRQVDLDLEDDIRTEIHMVSELVVPVFSPRSAQLLAQKLVHHPWPVTVISISETATSEWQKYRSDPIDTVEEANEDLIISRIRTVFS